MGTQAACAATATILRHPLTQTIRVVLLVPPGYSLQQHAVQTLVPGAGRLLKGLLNVLASTDWPTEPPIADVVDLFSVLLGALICALWSRKHICVARGMLLN